MGDFSRSQTFSDVVDALSDCDQGGSKSHVFRYDGRTYRATFSTVPDEWSAINDYDCWGKVEWCDRGMFPKRPDGFDGAARKLWTRSDPFWWQPPEGITPDTPGIDFDELVGDVRAIVEYGFQNAEIMVESRCECCGSYNMIASYSYGGIEPWSNFLRDPGVIGELLEAAWWQVEDSEVSA